MGDLDSHKKGVLQGEEKGAGKGGPLAQNAGPLHQECSQRGNQLRYGKPPV